MALKDDPRVVQFAKQGLPWATKIRTGGWKTLTTQQKRAARVALGLPLVPTAQVGLKVNRVSQPVATGWRIKSNEPRVSTAKRNMSITFQEMIGTVRKSAGLAVQSWDVNPSIVATFPQLSINATMYEKYRFTRLAVRFAPSCPTTAGGVVVMAFDPDSSDQLPTNTSALYGYSGTTRTSPFTPAKIEIPCDNVVRFIADNKSSDPKMINFGKIIVASYGQGTTEPDMLGELFVEYTVVLIDRQPSTKLTQRISVSGSVGPKLATTTTKGTSNPISFNIHFATAGDYIVSLYYPESVVSLPIGHNLDITDSWGNGGVDTCQVLVITTTNSPASLSLEVATDKSIPLVFISRA